MNAKKEFLNHIGNERVLCVYININNDVYTLVIGYTSNEFSEFISKLDFDYDDGYGSQNLFGTIWYMDGSWSERGEYDGSEWWEYKQVPKIPNFLDKNKIRAKKIDDII